MAAAKKKTSKKADTPSLVASLEVDKLLLEIDALNAKIDIIVDGFQLVADETRSIYGMGVLAPLFDAIVKKLRA